MDGPAPHHFAGIDWASDKHDVCVLDATGRIRRRCTTRHTADGLKDLVTLLDSFGPRDGLPLAIERPSGLLVDTLLEAGFPVVPVHPNALQATRPRYTAALSKSDPGDAYLLADVLRTDSHRFRPLRAPSDRTRALRAAVRTRDDLVATRVQLANQLRSLLESFWPGAAVIFADIDSPIALDFLDDFPSPDHAARLSQKRLERFLKLHAYCGRRSSAELLARLHAAPPGRAGALERETKAQLVRSLVCVLRPLVLQIRALDGLLAAHLAQHPDGPILQSFPRSGSVNAAQILAELGDDRLRFASFEQLAAEAGVAPVTRASGKHRTVSCRFACNKRLRQAITTWADNSRHAAPWAAARYRDARQRGCDHPHSVRILARAWCRVLWRCWHDRVSYHPTQHGRALPFLPAQALAPAA
ncbi:MAG TPA: IS110 family transposase [Longimicrobiaceae bacterium]|nr:IS110 family transposase [Longimicrobiaceae bacterium]